MLWGLVTALKFALLQKELTTVCTARGRLKRVILDMSFPVISQNLNLFPQAWVSSRCWVQTAEPKSRLGPPPTVRKTSLWNRICVLPFLQHFNNRVQAVLWLDYFPFCATSVTVTARQHLRRSNFVPMKEATAVLVLRVAKVAWILSGTDCSCGSVKY